MSAQSNEELKPYTVEVDDHSDDCGTVYRLKGPNVGILSKDEELLKERAEDFNLGFEMGRRSQEAPVAQVEVYRKALEEITNLSTGDCGDWVMKARWIAERAIEKALLTSKPEPVKPGKCQKLVGQFICGHTYRDHVANDCGHTFEPEPVAPVGKWEAEEKE